MLLPTPGLVLDYLPALEGAQLIRAYGDQPCITLPAALPGADGAPLPLTALGDYCFSERPRRMPPPEQLLRCAVQPDGTLQLTRRFGRAVPLPGQPRAGRGRYAFDFDPASPASSEPDEPLHPICGSFLEEITLPDSLRVWGSCAFYNCRALRRLSAGAAVPVMGSDVLLNAFALRELVMRAAPDAVTGLFALANSTTGHLRAVYQPEKAPAPLAAVWFPEYWEDIEETPAHILLHTFSGQGYHYRQCFLNNTARWADYDEVFPQGHDADDQTVMTLLCFDRLRYPYALSAQAAGAYRAFLAEHTGLALRALLKAQDIEGITALLALNVMDEAAFAEAAALAAKANNAEAAALLADAEYRLHAAKAAAQPKKKRYSFDF